LDRLLDFPLPGLAGGAEVVFELETEPEFGRRSQVSRQAQSGIGGDSAAPAYDIVEARRRDAQCFGELVYAHSQWLENIFAYGFAGMGNSYHISHNIILLMVVGDLDVVGVSILPDETDTVPVVDSDAVEPFPGTLQGFQRLPGIAAKSRRDLAWFK
jgi:hypothetical protein